MGRPVYNYELSDSDLSWLVSNFQENNPSYFLVESSCLPIVFIKAADAATDSQSYPVPVPPRAAKGSGLPENK